MAEERNCCRFCFAVVGDWDWWCSHDERQQALAVALTAAYYDAPWTDLDVAGWIDVAEAIEHWLDLEETHFKVVPGAQAEPTMFSVNGRYFAINPVKEMGAKESVMPEPAEVVFAWLAEHEGYTPAGEADDG